MSIWRFIPAVRRPWNPAYRDTWDAMTHRERQISFLIDVAIIVAVTICLFAGREFGRMIFP